MATKTLSASLDPAIYRAAQRAAKEERRPQSYVVAEALKLYTALPLEIRQMLVRLAGEESEGSEDLTGTVSAAISTAVLAAAFDALAAKLPPLDATEAEIDALAEEAVQWARHKDRG